jgi:hypothetical protein
MVIYLSISSRSFLLKAQILQLCITQVELRREIRVHMGRIVDHGIVVLSQHVRVVSRRAYGVPTSEEVDLVQTVETMFHHQLSQPFVDDLVRAVRVKPDMLIMTPQMEII